MLFSRKTAIVTGGTGALGSVLVREFLGEGAQVAVPTRSIAGAPPEPTSGKAAPTPFLVQCDVTQEADVAACVKRVESRFEQVDFLIHAAGGYAGGRLLEETPAAEWDALLAMNLRSAFLFARAVLPGMRSRNTGRILFVAAMTALKPGARHAAYAVAKGGLLTLVEALSAELRTTGITVNAVAPSTLDTDANAASMPEADRSGWVTPHEVWTAVRYLCSDDGRAVSGSTLRFPGGRAGHPST